MAAQRNNLERVKEFHQRFGHPVAEIPEIPSLEIRKLRARLLIEEVGEFVGASGLMTTTLLNLFMTLENKIQQVTQEHAIKEGLHCNIVEVADSLGDIEYVTHGASLVWGIPAQKVFEAIHASNMSKLGIDGKPVKRVDGKIMRGPNYWPPQGLIQKILQNPTEEIPLLEHYEDPQDSPHP